MKPVTFAELKLGRIEERGEGGGTVVDTWNSAAREQHVDGSGLVLFRGHAEDEVRRMVDTLNDADDEHGYTYSPHTCDVGVHLVHVTSESKAKRDRAVLIGFACAFIVAAALTLERAYERGCPERDPVALAVVGVCVAFLVLVGRMYVRTKRDLALLRRKRERRGTKVPGGEV